MNKKRFASLAPLLGVATFVVMPAVAQAEPHWYNKGKLVGEAPGVSKRFSGLATFQVGETKIHCRVVGADRIWNPAGGGAGEDSLHEFKTRECTSSPTLCPSQIEIVSKRKPWQSHLISGPPIRDVIEGVELEVRCSEGALGEDGLPWRCHGTLMPAVGENYLEFGGPGSSEIVCVYAGGGEDEWNPPEPAVLVWHCKITAKEDLYERIA